MTRKLPIAGQHRPSPSDTAALVTTVFVDARPAISVVGARWDVGADRFVAQLSAAVEPMGRTVRIERSADVSSDARLLVIIGSHVPRSARDPAASELWDRADLLLSEPSDIVARALVAAI